MNVRRNIKNKTFKNKNRRNRRKRNFMVNSFIKRRVKRKINRRRTNMSAAITKTFKRRFNVTNQGGNSLTVKGRDLVYAIPDNIVSTTNCNVITVIPANPCYWTGTRIAALAAGYQNYRPIKFKVSYVPQCAVTQQGNVIAGTLWSTIPSPTNFQQSLRTSPGGMLTQCYKAKTSNVKLTTNLQFNLFRCGGKFDQESNPFNFIGLSIACTNSQNQIIVPGYFYVEYIYTFKNPIGASHIFYNSGLIQLPEREGIVLRDNMAYVVCKDVLNNNLTQGMLLQLDLVNDERIFTYNDEERTVPAGSLVWGFSSSTIGAEANKVKAIPNVNYDFEYTDVASRNAGQFTADLAHIYFIVGNQVQDDTFEFLTILYVRNNGTIINPKAIEVNATKVYSNTIPYTFEYDEDLPPNSVTINNLEYSITKYTRATERNTGYFVGNLAI